MSRTLIVTGMAGAGRSTCLKVLEDLGFDAVDNLPVSLLYRLLQGEARGQGEVRGEVPGGLAVGIDSRSRGLEPQHFVAELQGLRAASRGSLDLVYLECEDEVLRRRFSATRRRHPLDEGHSVSDALAQERTLLAPLKQAASLVIDTSELAPPDLRRLIAGHFAAPGGSLKVTVTSFSFQYGVPREADLVFDVRFLRNPHYVEALRPGTGDDPPVQAYIRGDADYVSFESHVKLLLEPLLPRYLGEGKSYLTIAVGCTGGRHRSVYVAGVLAAWLRDLGWDTALRHRDLPAATMMGGLP